jgi:hypothetical protein
MRTSSNDLPLRLIDTAATALSTTTHFEKRLAKSPSMTLSEWEAATLRNVVRMSTDEAYRKMIAARLF